jgi:hypothetical protein
LHPFRHCVSGEDGFLLGSCCHAKLTVNALKSSSTDVDNTGDNQGPDDDNDGMPDAWEIIYGLDPHTNDADPDADGDGLSNLAGFQAQTHPTSEKTDVAPDTPVINSPFVGNPHRWIRKPSSISSSNDGGS